MQKGFLIFAGLAAAAAVGCAKAKLEADSPGILLQGVAGAPEPLTGKLRVRSDRAARITARTSERWLQVSPREGSAPADLSVSVDASELSSGSHTAVVTVESQTAERAVEFKIEVRLDKGSLKFAEPAVTLEATFGQERLSARVPLETLPARHRLRWRAQVREPWLDVVPDQGRGPAELELVARLKGFGIGQIEDTLVVESDDAANPARVKVFVRVRPGVVAAPEEIPFECERGSRQPLRSKVSLAAMGARSLPYRCQWTVPWLKIEPATGNAPSEPAVVVSPSGLAAGEHAADVLVEVPEANPVTFRVVVRVAKARLAVDAAAPIELEAFAGGSARLSASRSIKATGDIPIRAETSAPWLAVRADRGSTPVRLAIEADPSNLASGLHEAKVVVSSDDAEAPVEIPVKLKLKKCSLQVTSTLAISAVAGEDPPPAKIKLEIRPAGHRIQWAAVWSDRTRLRLRPSAGTGAAEIELSASAVALSDVISFESPDAEAPATCRVTVRVAPKLLVEPASLKSECAVGAVGTVPNDVRVRVLGRDKLAFTCSPGAPWIRTSVERAEAPADLRIELDPAGRPPGMYRSQVTFESSEGAAPVQIPVELTIRKTRIVVARDELAFEAFAGLAETPGGSVRVSANPDGAVEFTARAEADWITVTPAKGRTGQDVSLTLRTAGLRSGTHRGVVTIESEQAEAPVSFAVMLTVKKVRLLAQERIELVGTTAGERIPDRAWIETDPPRAQVRWKARAGDAELEVVPAEGVGPGQVEIAARGRTAAGKRALAVTIESEDAEAPARCTVEVTLHEAGTARAELYVGFHGLRRVYAAWAERLADSISRLAAQDPGATLRELESQLPLLKKSSERLTKDLEDFAAAVARLENRLRAEGLEAEGRRLSEAARGMSHRLENYSGEASKIAADARVETLKLSADPRWREVAKMDVRKGDIVYVAAKGTWNGSPEWPAKTPAGDGARLADDSRFSVEPTLPFFALLGSVGESGAAFVLGEERFLVITEEGEGALRLRPNYLRGENSGEIEVRVVRLRLPWYARTVFSDRFAPLLRDARQHEQAVREARADLLAGKITADELAARERDLTSNYPSLKKLLDGEARRRLVADGLREKLKE